MVAPASLAVSGDRHLALDRRAQRHQARIDRGLRTGRLEEALQRCPAERDHGGDRHQSLDHAPPDGLARLGGRGALAGLRPGTGRRFRARRQRRLRPLVPAPDLRGKLRLKRTGARRGERIRMPRWRFVSVIERIFWFKVENLGEIAEVARIAPHIHVPHILTLTAASPGADRVLHCRRRNRQLSENSQRSTRENQIRARCFAER